MSTRQVEAGISELIAIRYLRASNAIASGYSSRARERQREKGSREKELKAVSEARPEENGLKEIEWPELRSVEA